MHRLDLETLSRELGESEFLTLLDRIAQANYMLAHTLSRLHAFGFADWSGSFQGVLEMGAPAIAEALGSQIKDPELREAFYLLSEHTRSVVEIDQQIVAWLAKLVGLRAVHDKRGRIKLDRRLWKIAAKGTEEPRGPVWVTRPDYQALAEKSRLAMAAVAQAKGRFDRRLRQLLKGAGEVAPSEPALKQEALEHLISALPKDMQRLVVTSKLEGDFTYLQMEIVTYVDLWERAPVVVDFIERVWDAFEPFQVKLEAMVYSRWKSPHSMPRIFGLRPTWRKWAEIRRLLLEGEIARIEIWDWESKHSHCLRFDSDVYLGVHFGFLRGQARGHRMITDSIFDPREAKTFNLCINTRVWGGIVNTEVQQRIVSLACDLFQAVDAACGYVDVGNDYMTLDHLTPYERQQGLSMPNTKCLCKEVKGAFWGNLLSARHVQALGGSRLVTRQAPCYKIVPLASHTRAQPTDDVPLYLQLTEALGMATSEDYARLESFLAPILIFPGDQVGITILEPALVASLGNEGHLRQTLAGNVRRAVVLPRGALLVEYDKPSGWPRAYNALRQIGCEEISLGYREIPQPLSRWLDNAIVWTLIELIPPRPRGGPIYPAIIVEPCIPDTTLEFRVFFASPPTGDIEVRLRELIQEWSKLEYKLGSGQAMISYCAVPRREGDSLVWQADLAPVGQDAYFQLVVLLDGFSKTTFRLTEIHVGFWGK